MTMMLKDRIVVVAGGAGLIGREFVRSIVGHGGIAAIGDMNGRAAKGLINELGGGKPHNKAVYFKLDITSKDSLAAMISHLHGKFGKIDALVNSAYPKKGKYGKCKLEEVTYKDFCRNLAAHLGGYFLASQQFAAYFKKQGHGSIVNMASVYGVVAPRFSIYEGTAMTMPVEYAAIKSAIIHLTRYFAQYYKGANIRVNSISPGGVLDGQSDAFLTRYKNFAASKGMLDAGDLQGTLLYLLSDMSKYVNGQNIVVDDGWTL